MRKIKRLVIQHETILANEEMSAIMGRSSMRHVPSRLTCETTPDNFTYYWVYSCDQKIIDSYCGKDSYNWLCVGVN